jgi:hypothetical protein
MTSSGIIDELEWYSEESQDCARHCEQKMNIDREELERGRLLT